MVSLFIEKLRSEGKSELTIKQYRSNLKRFFSRLPDVDPVSVTQLDIAEFKKHMIQNGFKPSTVMQSLTHIKAFYNFLLLQNQVLDNPAAHVEPVTIPRVAPKWLDRNEQNRLLRAVRQHGDIKEQALITVLLHTGLRVEELSLLKLSELTLAERSGAVEVWGKQNRFRKIPLNIDARHAIEAYLEERTRDSEYLFDSQRSDRLTTRGIQHIIQKYANLTKIEHLTAHSLRHSFLHELSMRKTPLEVIAMIAGHMKKDGTPNIAMTVRYTLPDQADLQRAVDELSRYSV